MKNNTQEHTIRNRNEPGRFFGDGVSFKAKLIGILEVGEARGDRMCQEALQDLKMAIRAAGEHKQRITIHVTIDGLRLRDEKTGDSLYHHPVHKISFIAQDMTDSRAFGYIFGSPDSGHRFFGIKTDKAASQVVLAMRDLFQVVFELKKKEIELARQHIQSKITAHEHQAVALAVKNSNLETYAKNLNNEAAGGLSSSCKTTPKTEKSPESVADLVDLEQELSSIQRGITQMERITPNEVPSKSVIDSDDPFGDSFTRMPPAYNILPPPESSKRHQKTTKSTENLPTTETNAEIASPPPSAPPSSNISNQNDDWLNSPPNSSTFENETNKYSDELNGKSLDDGLMQPTSFTSASAVSTVFTDVFTDLDPLGTGKIRPYVDKKYFFQELKNPPKKVLKDLSGKESVFNANFSNVSDVDEQQNNSLNSVSSTGIVSNISSNSDLFKTNFEETKTDISSEFLDPFANKSVDPFMEDDDFSKLSLDPFDLNFSRTSSPRQTTSASGGENKNSGDDDVPLKSSNKEDGKNSDESVYNGPLQVNLPPESWANYISQKRLERQHSDSTTSPSGGTSSTARNRPSVFKQNTVDVISSISSSSKKMKPNIFSQKFSKRDSNSINMRRLQESDSLSENETAPEPPPRPDSGSHIEPPPLPPKKQFADIVIRPSPRSNTSGPPGSTRERYDYIGSKYNQKNQSSNDNAPPLPLPSRKVSRSDTIGSGPSPGRPYKKHSEEDDYMTPISMKSDIPTLLPPPQRKDASKTRATRKSETDPRNLDEPMQKTPTPKERENILPDITLSQLLTLGIDDLASKLSVPVSKLNTMTLVELTTYLSDFIENTKKPPSSANSWNQDLDSSNDSPVFKVNFDDCNETTFVAKFDDNFCEDSSFVANFESFNTKSSESSSATRTASVVDKYAVFREIIEKEIQPSPVKEELSKLISTNENNNGFDISSLDFNREVASEMSRLSPNTIMFSKDQLNSSTSQLNIHSSSPLTVPMTKIDTKITQVISQAKDRYAALRDIILVEDLFEKPTAPLARKESSSLDEKDTDDEQKFDANFDDIEKSPDLDSTSPEINISTTTLDDDLIAEKNLHFRNTPKDDLEIDEYMKKAVSNLSLHSNDHISPGIGLAVKSPLSHLQNTSTSPMIPLSRKSPIAQKSSIENLVKTTLNDMCTSPIPIQKSPVPKTPLPKSPLVISKSPIDATKSPTLIAKSSTLIESYKRSSGSLSDVCESSPEMENSNENIKVSAQTPTNESWAVFDQHEEQKSKDAKLSREAINKNGPESPCSSDPKDEWKTEPVNRRWPAKGHTSSSSRDVSPWDEDGPDYRRRPPTGHHVSLTSGERYHHPRHPPRRINSCDEEYEEEIKERNQRRRMKSQVGRNKDNFDVDGQNWYHTTDHHNWSPAEEEDRPDRSRSFDRNAYERSTYGPPYEKREPKSLPPYDRRDYKNYDKRKYYRERGRPDYDYDPYAEGYEPRISKGRPDYEEVYDRGTRDARSAREYFYERERKSFDRDSNESYDSNRARRSFGSGDIYGSLDSRGEYRDRDRYLSLEKTRSLRRGMRTAGNNRIEDPDQDSDGDVVARRADTSSLQRSSQNIRGKQVIDDEVWGVTENPRAGGITALQKSTWKRPASATEQERRYPDGRRMLGSTSLVGSDGEKDRRFRKKNRTRGGKDMEIRSNYATLRYPPRQKGDDYFDFEDEDRAGFENDEDEIVGGKMMTDNLDDSPSYYPRRQAPYYKATTPRSEQRNITDTLMSQETKKGSRFEYEEDARRMKKSNSRDLYFENETKDRYGGKFGSGNFEELTPKSGKHVRGFEFDEFSTTPQPNVSAKFNFEDGGGFESDFNSPPPKSVQTPQTGTSTGSHNNPKSFRFSNDFSEKEPNRQYQNFHKPQPPNYGFEADFSTTPTPTPNNPPQSASKLRFNDNVTVSKFDSNSNTSHMFEDDFAAKSDLNSENEMDDQWTAELPPTNGNKKILKTSSQAYENIKKSESVNIFAKKSEDPFEDDDFFATGGHNGGKNGSNKQQDPFNSSTNAPSWDKNFANFDDNI